MYKLIACDVDGTLIDERFVLSRLDIDAVAKAREKGIVFALCSGRSYRSLRVYARDLGVANEGDFIIGFNGGLIYDPHNDRVVKKEELDKGVGVELVRFYKNSDINMEIVVYFDGEGSLVEKNSEYAGIYHKTSRADWFEAEDIVAAASELKSIAKIIFIGDNSDLQAFEKELTASHLRDEAEIFFSSRYLLEAVPKGCDKAGGVQWLCERLGIEMAEVIAIGDNYNDLGMIKAAGLGVAVANAVKPAKEIADYVTVRDCANGAVAEVIEKFILGL